jgi:hypothetical protein
MKEITIQLEIDSITAWEFPDDNTILIELPKGTFEKYEQKTKNLGINTYDALAHGIITLIKNGF